MASVYTYDYVHIYMYIQHVFKNTYDIFDWVSLVVVSLHCRLIFSKVKTTLMALLTGTSFTNFSPFSTCPLCCREAPWWQYQLGALGRLCLLTLGCPCCDLWGTCFLRFQWLHQLWKKTHLLVMTFVWFLRSDLFSGISRSCSYGPPEIVS